MRNACDGCTGDRGNPEQPQLHQGPAADKDRRASRTTFAEIHLGFPCVNACDVRTDVEMRFVNCPQFRYPSEYELRNPGKRE
jgi:hypothetical protein